MPPAPLPSNETERLAALRSYDVLDSVYESAYDEIARAAARLTRCSMGAVSMIDADRQWFKAQQGLGLVETPRSAAFCAYAILGADPLVVEDASLDSRFADNPLVQQDPRIRFYAGIPLINPDGHALGTLCVADREPRGLSNEERESLVGLARAAMMTLELRRKMRQMQGMAMTDALTGLPNRAAFTLSVDQAIARLQRHQEPFALLYVDLDGFKAVNDRFGHAEGDQVLQAVARILRQHVRGEDDLGRLGGDEFALLTADDAAGQSTADRLRDAMADAMSARNWPVTCSIGSVSFTDAPPDAATAIAAADRAMYLSKTAGKNRVTARQWNEIAASC